MTWKQPPYVPPTDEACDLHSVPVDTCVACGDSEPERRVCAECWITVRPGDGGVRAHGRLYCSEECADDAE